MRVASTMAKQFPHITDAHRDFISRQYIFFTASAVIMSTAALGYCVLFAVSSPRPGLPRHVSGWSAVIAIATLGFSRHQSLTEAAHVVVALQAGGETETDRLQNGIDPKANPGFAEKGRRVVERVLLVATPARAHAAFQEPNRRTSNAGDAASWLRCQASYDAAVNGSPRSFAAAARSSARRSSL